MLNEMQKDVLTELVNVYIGKAASLLSEMIERRVVLSIPRVELIKIPELDCGDCEIFNIMTPGHVISSSISFGYDFEGKALLLFPAEQAKTLVNACMGEGDVLNGAGSLVTLMDTDFDVLKEISNIILNAIIGEFANLLDIKIENTIPEVELIWVSGSDQKTMLDEHIYILLMYTSFSIAEIRVTGLILMALSMNSVSWLIDTINRLVEGLDV